MNKRKTKKMYRKLARLSAAVKADYPAGGTCLCFCCGQRFPVSAMREEDWLEEWDGRITALCPYCTQDTVLPDSGHFPAHWIRAAQKYGFGGSIMQGGTRDPENGKTTYHWGTIIAGDQA